MYLVYFALVVAAGLPLAYIIQFLQEANIRVAFGFRFHDDG